MAAAALPGKMIERYNQLVAISAAEGCPSKFTYLMTGLAIQWIVGPGEREKFMEGAITPRRKLNSDWNC